jgi:alpha-amylase
MKTKGLFMFAVLAILAAVGFASCEGLANEDNPMASYLTMRTSDVTLKLDETYVRKAVAAGTAVVTYSSSDEAIATVDKEGKVTALNQGTVKITAKTTGYNAEGKQIYMVEEKSYKVTVTPQTITVYVNVGSTGWASMNYWTWGGDGTHSPTNGSWPGDNITTTVTVGGKTWYKQTYTINSQADFVNFVFSTGTVLPVIAQTVDIENIRTDKYFEISTTLDGVKHLVDDVTSTYATE